jgi:hypothetical protein
MAPQGNSDDLQRICTYVTLKTQIFVGLIDGVRESAQSWRDSTRRACAAVSGAF